MYLNSLSGRTYILKQKCVGIDALRQGVDMVKDEALHNMMVPMGLMWAFRQALRCRKKGLALLGIPCNSFVFMSISQHQRSFFDPLGSQLYSFVITGNALAARACLIVQLCICRSVFWLTENPKQSALQYFPVLQHIMTIPEVLSMRIDWYGSWLPYHIPK